MAKVIQTVTNRKRATNGNLFYESGTIIWDNSENSEVYTALKRLVWFDWTPTGAAGGGGNSDAKFFLNTTLDPSDDSLPTADAEFPGNGVVTFPAVVLPGDFDMTDGAEITYEALGYG